MINRAYEKFQNIRTQLKTDLEYLELEARRREAEPAFLSALEMLDADHRQAVINYLGILEEMGLRETELACFSK